MGATRRADGALSSTRAEGTFRTLLHRKSHEVSPSAFECVAQKSRHGLDGGSGGEPGGSGGEPGGKGVVFGGSGLGAGGGGGFCAATRITGAG